MAKALMLRRRNACYSTAFSKAIALQDGTAQAAGLFIHHHHHYWKKKAKENENDA